MQFHCQYRLSLPSLIRSQGEGSKNNIKSTNGFFRHSVSHTESLKNSDFLPEKHKSCSSKIERLGGRSKKEAFSLICTSIDAAVSRGWNFNQGGAIASISFRLRHTTRDQKQPRRGDSSARHNSERHESRRAMQRESFAACRGRARSHPSACRQAIRAADKLERHV